MNTYLIGGKGNMMQVGVSVYCRLLCRPEEIEEKQIYFSLVTLGLNKKILYRNLWKVLSKMYWG